MSDEIEPAEGHEHRPPPPAWQPAQLYDFEAAGEDPALEPTTEIVAPDVAEGVAPSVANARGERVANGRGDDGPATLATWLRYVTGDRGGPRPEGVAKPGRHAWRGVAHWASVVRAWAYDETTHPEHWKLTELKPHYVQKQAAYDEKEAAVRQAMAERQKVLLYAVPGAVLAVLLTLVILVVLGAFFVIFGAVALTVISSSATGRHVAKKRGAAVALDVAEVENATLATPVAMGREELENALRLTGSPRVLGPDEQVIIRNPRPRPDGWTVEVTLPPGRMARQVLRARHDLAGNLGTTDRLVHLEPGAGSNRDFTLRRFTQDPFDRLSAVADLLAVKRCSVWSPFPVAYTLEGEPVMAGCTEGAHWLFGGGTGSGKSAGARLLALAGAMDPHATAMVFDPQRSTAWGLYQRIFEVHQGSADIDIRTMAQRADWLWRVEMERRGSVISRFAAEFPAQCPDDRLTKQMAENEALNCPFLFVFFEEAHSLFASSVPFDPDPDSTDKRTCGQVIQRAAQELVTRARRVGVCVVGITQKPSGKNVSTDIRDIFPTRSCGACRTEAMAKMVLGDDYADHGMEPTALVEDLHAGWHYIYGSGLRKPRLRPWVLARYGYVDNNQLRLKLRDVEAMRREVRPALVWASASDSPQAPPTAVMVAERPAGPETADPAPGDPGHLAEIEAVFLEGEAELHSATIIKRLRRAHPDRYGWLTPAGMNAFLKRIDPSLRTTNVRETVNGERKQAKGLRLSVVIDCYDALVPDGTGDDA